LDGIPELLEKIKQRGIPCHVLSNYPVWFEALNEKVGLDQYIEEMFVSYKIGIRKPDIAIYEYVLQKLNVQPQKILFVDDRLENCIAAGSLGMQYHHFQSVDALRTKLHQHRIL
jgi:putative hydrolase of the HAD superfamily